MISSHLIADSSLVLPATYQHTVTDAIIPTSAFSVPVAAVLLALLSFRRDDKGTTTRRLRRGLSALSEHAPPTWGTLFAWHSCGVAASASGGASTALAAPVALPRTLAALTGLLGVQLEGGVESGAKRRPVPEPAAVQRARTRASSTAAVATTSAPAAVGMDPVHVLPAEAMVHVFRFLGYRYA
jgi:hypothetical protein